jgi:hypothetical protein
LAISPPTGPITTRQAFDLTLIANTGGAALTGFTASIDGLDVSGPLAACLQAAGTLTGPVTGPVLSCHGLSGGLLSGFFGTGPHTLSVAVTLADGRTIADAATWLIRP